MHFNRTAILAILVLAFAAALPIRVPTLLPGGREKNSPQGSEGISKFAPRTAQRSQSPAFSQLKQMAETAAADPNEKPTPAKLAKACGALDAEELGAFLDDKGLWPDYSSSDPDLVEKWERCLRLTPFREAALERLGVLDLRRGLLSYPSGARALLTASAKVDGPQALQIWLGLKEEWKLLKKTHAWDSFQGCMLIEGVGLLRGASGMDFPTPEQEALAALGKGWASTDPEGAWQAVRSRDFDHLSPAALAGMIEGLRSDTDWAAWSEKIGSLEWPQYSDADVFPMILPEPQTESVLRLAQRWIQTDPTAALEWYSGQEALWSIPQGLSPVCAFEAGITSSGGQTAMPALAHAYATWLETDADACLGWMSEQVPSDEMLADLVRWTEFPKQTKVPVIALVRNSDLKADLAMKLAQQAASPGAMAKPEEGFEGIIDELRRLEGLDETTSARLLSLKKTGR